ncbi:MAG: hypothetical protein A3F42_03315 [Gammaproteobacteria bacterium RIFCSPHIGHO2_12_FULL_37_34]|nr:MAG: hypothetical protein A3F42_03315 [Gammaproteobacteria bacterium RIFCSPHIGHO2_12_FULL_37_34]
MNRSFTKDKTIEHIRGPAGKLEVAIDEPIGEERHAWGIVCHPHPLHGGNMQNKVVTTLVKTFQYLGLTTIRFNFRGVGRSEGEFAHGIGELEDLLTVIEWVQQSNKGKEIWLAGFSFGAYIVAKAATQISVGQLVTVAPPVQDYSLETLPSILCPWILIQGELDDVVSPAAVLSWAESRYPKPLILRFPEAGHFFHGQLIELRTQLEQALLQLQEGHFS